MWFNMIQRMKQAAGWEAQQTGGSSSWYSRLSGSNSKNERRSDGHASSMRLKRWFIQGCLCLASIVRNFATRHDFVRHAIRPSVVSKRPSPQSVVKSPHPYVVYTIQPTVYVLFLFHIKIEINFTMHAVFKTYYVLCSVVCPANFW